MAIPVLLSLTLFASLYAAWRAREACALLRAAREEPVPLRRGADTPTPDRILREWLYGGDR